MSLNIMSIVKAHLHVILFICILLRKAVNRNHRSLWELAVTFGAWVNQDHVRWEFLAIFYKQHVTNSDVGWTHILKRTIILLYPLNHLFINFGVIFEPLEIFNELTYYWYCKYEHWRQYLRCRCPWSNRRNQAQNTQQQEVNVSKPHILIEYA